MSRSLTAQLTIVVLLIAVLVAMIVNIAQVNNIEQTVIDTRTKVEHQETMLGALQQKIDSGVRVSGGGGDTKNNPNVGATEEAGNLVGEDPMPLLAPGAKEGGSLVLETSSDFKGFNILVENSVDVSTIYELFVGGYLARRQYGDPEKWHGDLAVSVVPNADFTVYHVKLRQGVKWHRPAVDFSNPRYKWLDKDHEVVADDFVFTLEMIMDPKVEGAAPQRSYFEHFDKIEVINDHEFNIVWKKKLYMSKSTTLSLYPVPRWLYGADEDGTLYPKETVGLKMNNHWYNDRGIGVGPYQFAESKPGEYLKMTRFDQHHRGRVAIKDMTYLIVRDPETQMLRFKKGELDSHAMTPTQYRTQILEADANSPFKTGQFKYDRLPRLVYRYIGWNMKDPLFQDKRARQAMSHAFNREKIIKEVFVGLGRPVNSTVYIDNAYYNNSLVPYAFDLDKASKLLEEAGWIDGDKDGIREKVVDGQKKKFEFQFVIVNNSPEFKSAADIFKEDLIKIGVKMDIIAIDWPTMQKKMEGKEFQGYFGGWGLDWETDLRQLWHSSQADEPKGSNFVSFKNKEADTIIENLEVAFSFEERKKLLDRFQEIAHDEQPYTFFMAPDSIITYAPSINNVVYQKPRPQVLYQLMWKQQ